MPHRKIITVCINAHPRSGVLLRCAANKAAELNIPWQVLYIETPDHYIQDKESRERVLRFLTLAEEMGAEIHHSEHPDPLQGIVSFVADSQQGDAPIKYLILGQSTKEGFFEELKASLAERITREVRKFSTEVQIIPLTGKHYKSSWFDRLQLREVKIQEIFYALLSVLVAYVATEILHMSVSTIEWRVNKHNVMAFFLIACVISSLRFGLVPGLVSAIAGFTVINYFYIAPLHNFGLDHSADSISLFIFLISAVTMSLMGAYSRATNSALLRKERRTQALYKVYRLASEATERSQALEIFFEELSRLLEMEIAFFMPSATHDDTIDLAYPYTTKLSEKDWQLLKLCWDEVRTTGLGTMNRMGSSWRFEPLITNKNEIGVLAIKVPGHIRLDASFGRLLTALADQAAVILERIEMTKMMSESHIREEREKLRAMLLSSVSHDLKTPLASIIGSLSVYKRMRRTDRLDDDIADKLTETALDEAQRLDSFISNILDMTRIESGEIMFEEEWIDPADPLRNVEKRLRQRLSNHTLVKNPTTSTPVEVQMDVMMTEQVLQNIIDNAVKYSPPTTEIHVSYGVEHEGGFTYRIRDHGPGIPEDKLEAVFDKYERLKQSDSQVPGTGLGLAIAKAVMDKQNGSIIARNHEEGGAEFILWFAHTQPTSSNRRKVA